MTKPQLRKEIKNQLESIIALEKKGQCKINRIEEARKKILTYLCDNFNIKNLHFIKIDALADIYGDDKMLTIKYYIDVYSNSYNIVGNMECIIYDLRKANEWKVI